MIQLFTGATSAEEANRRAAVAVLPIGSFEQHGEYLPLATDTIVAGAIVQEIARNYSIRSLPPITISCSHEHAAWPGTVSISAQTPTMSLFPHSNDWTLARQKAGMATNSHTDMHAGELETSILLHVAPDLVRPGFETADQRADDRPHLLTFGMNAYTDSGVIGFPSQGSAEKGAACLRSLAE